MAFDKDARTAFANRAVVVSEMFNLKLRDLQFSGQVARKPKVMPPETESTGGGKMARNTIALVPLYGDPAEGGTLVTGWIDLGDNTAELRSYTAMLNRHRARFGTQPFDVDRTEYERFLGEANAFLLGEGITATLLDEPEQPLPQHSAPPTPKGEITSPARHAPKAPGMALGPAFLVAAVVLGVAVGMGVMYLLTRGS